MSNQTIKIGGGLHQDSDVISVMKAGKLRFLKPNKYWVESSQKRVNAASPSTVIIVSNGIMKSESLSGTQQRIMAQKLLE